MNYIYFCSMLANFTFSYVTVTLMFGNKLIGKVDIDSTTLASVADSWSVLVPFSLGT